MTSLAQALAATVRGPKIARDFSQVGFRRHQARFDPADLDVSLKGKTFVVTGANRGLGFAVADGLAARDADVWLLCRDRSRGEEAAEKLGRRGNGTIRIAVVDMSSLASVRALALPEGPVQGLVHNAGALFDDRTTTDEGHERTFALHVLGPQLLTQRLLPRLEGRVIYVASGGMYAERLDVDRLVDPPEPFDGVKAYAQAKRAQVVLAEQWAAKQTGVDFYAMHPGWADTGGVQSSLPTFYRVTKRWLRTPEEGADSALWLAACPELPVPSGAFVFDRQPAPRHLLPGTEASPAEQTRLVDTVAALTASEAPPDDAAPGEKT